MLNCRILDALFWVRGKFDFYLFDYYNAFSLVSSDKLYVNNAVNLKSAIIYVRHSKYWLHIHVCVHTWNNLHVCKATLGKQKHYLVSVATGGGGVEKLSTKITKKGI